MSTSGAHGMYIYITLAQRNFTVPFRKYHAVRAHIRYYKLGARDLIQYDLVFKIYTPFLCLFQILAPLSFPSCIFSLSSHSFPISHCSCNEGLIIRVFTDVSAGCRVASREGKSASNFFIISCTACSFSYSR